MSQPSTFADLEQKSAQIKLGNDRIAFFNFHLLD